MSNGSTDESQYSLLIHPLFVTEHKSLMLSGTAGTTTEPGEQVDLKHPRGEAALNGTKAWIKTYPTRLKSSVSA